MQGRRSILLLASTALVLFLVGKQFLPSGGADRTLYQPRSKASVNGEAQGYRGALEYYKDLYKGGDAQTVRNVREAVEGFAGPKGGSIDLDWNMQGPTDQGGRTRSILKLKGSSQMWVGSVSGGLWRSFDGGENWEPITAFNEHCVVSSMAQTGDGKIYVATGSTHESPDGQGGSGFRGRGLFVTSDKGGSFDLVSGTLPDTNSNSSPWNYINEIEADPTNNTGMWVARSGGFVYYDASTGNFDPVNNVFGAAEGLEVSQDGSHILVSNGAGTVFLSTDGGNNFTEISGFNAPLPDASGRVEVAIAPSNKDYMYVSMANSNRRLGGVYMTKDGGDTWGQISGSGAGGFQPFSNSLQGQGNYDQAIAVDPGNPKRIVLGGVSLWSFNNQPTQFDPYAGQWSQLATTNGFPATVPFYVHADVHTFDWRTSDKLYIGTDGGVFVSKDGLETFVPSSKNFVSTQFYDVEMSPDDQILGGAQDNGTLYLDRSDGWTEATQVRGGDGFDCEISQMDPSVVFSTTYGNQGSIYALRSTTGGGGMSIFLNTTDIDGLADDFYSNIELFEDRNDTLSKDSVSYINTNEDSSTIQNGDTITFESKTLGKEVKTTLHTDSLPYMDTVKLQDPVQSLFAFSAHNNGTFYVFVTRDALRLTNSTVKAHPVLNLGSYNGGIPPGTMTPNAYAFSENGDHLFIGMRDGSVHRVSGMDSAYGSFGFNNNVSSTEIISANGYVCTDISTDPNDEDHVVVTYGGYGANQKVLQSYNATSSSPSFNNIFSSSSSNLTADLARMPIYSVLIEKDDPNVILVGTEYGVFATDDAGSTWYHQDRDPLGHVPVFSMEQQTRDWSQGAKNPGHIYLGTHGRGFVKTDDFKSVKPKDKLEAESGSDATLELFPNPASNEAFLSLSDLPQQQARIGIYDLQGRRVRDMGERQLKGSEQLRMDLQDLKEGIYVVRVQGTDLDRTAKLVISR